jgi:hypothetical protein
MPIVREHDTVTDEHLVADLDARADEHVARNLAGGSHDRATLDLDERADACPVSDLAAVEVDEFVHDDALAERDAVDQPAGSVVARRASHD